MREIPAGSFEEFTSDKRNVASAESYIRRALEALLDLGRHLLAKGFGDGVVEYREIARRLEEKRVISPETGAIFTDMVGYRNRLTHFYDEVTPEELYEILTTASASLRTFSKRSSTGSGIIPKSLIPRSETSRCKAR